MNTSTLLAPIFSTLRQNVLAALLLQPDKAWYMLELANHLKISRSSLQRELACLAKAEFILSYKDGNRVYYQANRNCPILPELQGILTKTVGIFDLIRNALTPLSARIEVAFIYGSFAEAAELVSSDVDVLIIGNLGLADIAVALRPVQRQIKREVNPVVLSIEEARAKLLAQDHFLTSLKKCNKFFLIGNNSDLGKAFS